MVICNNKSASVLCVALCVASGISKLLSFYVALRSGEFSLRSCRRWGAGNDPISNTQIG